MGLGVLGDSKTPFSQVRGYGGYLKVVFASSCSIGRWHPLALKIADMIHPCLTGSRQLWLNVLNQNIVKGFPYHSQDFVFAYLRVLEKTNISTNKIGMHRFVLEEVYGHPGNRDPPMSTDGIFSLDK